MFPPHLPAAKPHHVALLRTLITWLVDPLLKCAPPILSPKGRVGQVLGWLAGEGANTGAAAIGDAFRLVLPKIENSRCGGFYSAMLEPLPKLRSFSPGGVPVTFVWHGV